MDFKTFFYLKESPDEVYTNDGEWLNPGQKDSRAFGWFAYLEDVNPFLLCSTKWSTHWDLYNDFFNHVKNVTLTKKQSTPPKNMIVVPDMGVVYEQLKKSKHWSSIVDGSILQNIDNTDSEESYSDESSNESSNESGGDSYSISTEVESVYRTKVFNNSGRIWIDNGVISFWNKQGDVPTERILQVLNLFGKKPEEFYIDVVDPKNLKDEEMSNKVLPTVKDYISKKFDSARMSKEDERKYQELLAKKHIATDPQERKRLQAKALGNTEPEWGSAKVAKDTPLELRQKTFTSESKKH